MLIVMTMMMMMMTMMTMMMTMMTEMGMGMMMTNVHMWYINPKTVEEDGNYNYDESDDIYIMVKCLYVCNVFAYFYV